MRKTVAYLMAILLVFGIVAMASCQKESENTDGTSASSASELIARPTEAPTQEGTEKPTEAPTDAATTEPVTTDPEAGSWSPKV